MTALGGDELAALATVAEQAALAAGEQLLQRWGARLAVETKTSATDPVSDADRAAERLLTEMLTRARPDDGLLGEEGALRPDRSGLRWVIDPLDGTVNYLYGIPAWCVSVACEDDQGTVVAVVHDPVHQETFRAQRGGGAWLAGAPLRVNDPVPLDRALIATGFAYAADVRARQGRRAAALLPRVRDLRRAGSAALDLCAVAAGRVDGYYEDATHHWDWAAGALIAAEAGADVQVRREGILAAGHALAGPLQEALTDW